MTSTSPAWHFRRLVTISHPKSLKTAKFTYCWLWILTCGPRCAPKCGDSKAVRLWIPWKNFDWKKKSALEPHVNQRGLDWKKLIELRFSTFVGWSFKSREKIAGEIRPCPKHESEVISTHPQYTIGNLNLYQTNWYGQVLSCKKKFSQLNWLSCCNIEFHQTISGRKKLHNRSPVRAYENLVSEGCDGVHEGTWSTHDV